MTRLTAAWVVPVDQAPIPNGWVDVDGTHIVGVGETARAGAAPGPVRRFDHSVLLPGLVNAHTHLELSWLRDRVPPANAFTSWVKQLFAQRGAAVERPDDPKVLAAAEQAAREASETGTVAVGDVSNSLASVGPIVRSGMHGLVFHELIGFRDSDGGRVALGRTPRLEASGLSGRVRVSVAPHAPYSVSAELFQAIRTEASANTAAPYTTVHVGESPEEMELLADGTGEWARLLRMIGAWREGWKAPGLGPVEYLDGLGFFDTRTLAVHAVQLDDASLARLRDRGATVVTCPRSNQWVGVGAPPVARFYASGVPVAVGTDSLASVADLNLFSELHALRWLAPEVPASRILDSGTRTGARALGLEHALGTLTPGKLADVLAVDLPPGVSDVPEYLVSGVPANRISWAWRSDRHAAAGAPPP